MSLRAGVLAGFCLFSGYVLQTLGLRYTTASKAAFLTGFTTPMVAVLSSIVYRRAPQFIEVLGVATAFVGMALMTDSRAAGSRSAGAISWWPDAPSHSRFTS